MANFDFKNLTFLKQSEVPASAGRRVSTPQIGITENGQGRFAKAILTNEKWVGKTRVWMGWNPEARVLGIMPIGDKLPKGVAETDLFPLRISEKNPDNVYISLAGTLRLIGYDFKESGNQTFPVELDEHGRFSFHIPEKLEKRPAAPRKPKSAPAASVKAEAGSTTAIPATEAPAATEEAEDLFA